MKIYKALIIDDEIDNITLLKIHLTRNCPNIEIVGQATNVIEGIEQYSKEKIDILFLDINLGIDDSFTFLDSIINLDSEIIFVSSYDEFGVKAIKYNAVGYIIKPIDVEDLKKAVNKAIISLNNKERLKEVMSNQGDNSVAESFKEYPELIAIPSADKIDIVHVDYIVYAEADGRYTIFHLTNGCKKIASKNLGEYEKLFNPRHFFRIHHRYIVNLHMITNINKSAGNYCELLNNISLPIAKRRQDQLHRFLNIK